MSRSDRPRVGLLGATSADTRQAHRQKDPRAIVSAMLQLAKAGASSTLGEGPLECGPGRIIAMAVVYVGSWHNRTNRAGLMMSVDWGRPEAVGGASNRGF